MTITWDTSLYDRKHYCMWSYCDTNLSSLLSSLWRLISFHAITFVQLGRTPQNFHTLIRGTKAKFVSKNGDPGPGMPGCMTLGLTWSYHVAPDVVLYISYFRNSIYHHTVMQMKRHTYGLWDKISRLIDVTTTRLWLRLEVRMIVCSMFWCWFNEVQNL